MGHRAGYRPILDRGHLGRIGLDSILTDDMSQEQSFGLEEGTLLHFSLELVLSEDFQNFTQMHKMLFRRPTVNEDVIKVYHHTADTKMSCSSGEEGQNKVDCGRSASAGKVCLSSSLTAGLIEPSRVNGGTPP